MSVSSFLAGVVTGWAVTRLWWWLRPHLVLALVVWTVKKRQRREARNDAA